MESWKGAVAFGQRGLANVVAGKFTHALGCRDGSERLASVDLTRGRDRLHARRTANVRPRVSLLLEHGVRARINRTGMQGERQIQGRRQSLVGPIPPIQILAQLKSEQSCLAHISENEIEPISPRIFHYGRVA